MASGRTRPRPLGSTLKDSRKMAANWLVRLFRSMLGSVVARAGVMSIGYGLKGNCGGFHNKSRWLLTDRRH
jgi:hypothetical protein